VFKVAENCLKLKGNVIMIMIMCSNWVFGDKMS